MFRILRHGRDTSKEIPILEIVFQRIFTDRGASLSAGFTEVLSKKWQKNGVPKTPRKAPQFTTNPPQKHHDLPRKKHPKIAKIPAKQSLLPP
jgi:hypothetical protein